MPESKLIIAGPDEQREVILNAGGVVIGRHPKCDIVLESSKISRRHARIFLDPFDRWIIEDMDSQNGVFVGGKRVTAHAVLAGEKIALGPFRLTLDQRPDRGIEPDPSAPTSTTLIEGAADVEVVREGSTAETPLSRACLGELNRIVDRLTELTSPSELYPELCRLLAAVPNNAALVLRLAQDPPSSGKTTMILACHLGGEGVSGPQHEKPNLHLSRRVLDAVRTSGQPVMAKSGQAADEEMSLTITDPESPRVVLCAPLGEQEELIEALYLDMPFHQAGADAFEFFQAVARQVRLVRRGLLLLELRAQRVRPWIISCRWPKRSRPA